MFKKVPTSFEVGAFPSSHIWLAERLERELKPDSNIERMQEPPERQEARRPRERKFVGNVKSELGFKAAHREVIEGGGTYALREQGKTYGSNFTGENEALRSENTRFWNENSEFTAT